jgi:geranylgeranyl diphosphate synthase type II
MERLNGRAPGPLLEAMRYSLVDGGKRVRPILVLTFAEAVAKQTGGGGSAAEDAACAVEYIHTYSLIHDDLPALDNDDLRRGRPTNHKVYGEGVAVLAGDGLLTEAFALVAGTQPSAVRAALVRELAVGAGATGMVGGQYLDISEDRKAKLEYLTLMHRLKTGALIRSCCRLGVIAAEGSAEALELASTYGDSVGLAFQIADDLLDVTSSSEALGKPAGADARAGRHTFPTVLGLEESKALAAREAEKAVAAARTLGSPLLERLARYVVERKS